MAKRKKISRAKKIFRVLRRKWFKPALVTIFFSLLIYLIVSHVVEQTHTVKHQPPQFVITRISDTFDETEFSHLLLTIQEINKIPSAGRQLKEFANMPYPSGCSQFLAEQLRHMNWTPQAFLVRIKKLFSMYDNYDRLQRIKNTMTFLSGEVEARRLPQQILEQVKILQEEYDKILETEFPENEYNFIDEYVGLISTIKEN